MASKRTYSEMSNTSFKKSNKAARFSRKHTSPTVVPTRTLATATYSESDWTSMRSSEFRDFSVVSAPHVMQGLPLGAFLPADLIFRNIAILAPELGSVNKSYYTATLHAYSEALKLQTTTKLPPHVLRLLVQGRREELRSLLSALSHLWTSNESMVEHVLPLWKALAPLTDPAVCLAAAKLLFQVQTEIHGPNSSVTVTKPVFKDLFTSHLLRYDNAQLLDFILTTGVVKCANRIHFSGSITGRIPILPGVRKETSHKCRLTLTKHLLDKATLSWSDFDFEAIVSNLCYAKEEDLLKGLLRDPRAITAAATEENLANEIASTAFLTNDDKLLQAVFSWCVELNLAISETRISNMVDEGTSDYWKDYDFSNTLAVVFETVNSTGSNFKITHDNDANPIDTISVPHGSDPAPLLAALRLPKIAKRLLSGKRSEEERESNFGNFMGTIGKRLSEEDKRKIVNRAIDKKRDASAMCTIARKLIYPPK